MTENRYQNSNTTPNFFAGSVSSVVRVRQLRTALYSMVFQAMRVPCGDDEPDKADKPIPGWGQTKLRTGCEQILKIWGWGVHWEGV